MIHQIKSILLPIFLMCSFGHRDLFAQSLSPSASPTGAPAVASISVVDFKYEDSEKGFEMQVPADWKVQKDFANYALFMEPSAKVEPTPENPVVADPNITISVTRNPIPVDEISLVEYEKTLIEGFTTANGAGSELSVFQRTMQDLPGGKKGLLYYLTYKRSGYDVVSAVLVMSNSNVLYRATLTDYKVGFDTNLEKLFPVMASIQVVGEPMPRKKDWEAYAPVLITGFSALVLLSVAIFVRNRRLKNLMGTFSSGNSNVEDLENEMLGKSSGRTGKRRAQKSRPPASSAGSERQANGIVPLSEAEHSTAAASLAASSAAPQSVAFASFEPSSEAASSVAAKSMADVGGEIASKVPNYKNAQNDAPESLAFNMSEVPESQPLSVAFAAESKPAKNADFKAEGQFGSQPPRSDSPLPVGKKSKSNPPENKIESKKKSEPELSGFDKSMFGKED